jgi:elongation factor 1-gamma
MAFGKLYTYPGNPRSTAIRAVANANNIDLEIVPTEPAKGVSEEYLKLNKLGKVPTFVGEDGFTLHESIAIAIYITSQNEKTTLLGKTKQDYATILKWMSFFNSEVLPSLGGWFRPLLGRDPYNKRNVDDAIKATGKCVSAIEEHLLHNTYLAGERVTLADLYAAGIISRGFQYFFDKEWRAANPNTTRWYETVYNQPIYSAVVDKLALIDEPVLKNQAPKKAEQPKKEAKQAAKPKPKAKEPEDDEDEDLAPPEPKAKHPLEALPKPTIPLDEWKRQYSNNSGPDAMKWFWENYKPDEYSLWKVDYLYPESLNMTFMSSNLIGGFHNRLEGSRKYLFGVQSVYGVTKDSYIQGAFMALGQESHPAFDVAPDYESYSFTKLDASKPEDKQFIEEQWVTENGITVNGKEYPWAAKKVFK